MCGDTGERRKGDLVELSVAAARRRRIEGGKTSAVQRVLEAPLGRWAEPSVDERTLRVVQTRRGASFWRRGWLVRRALLAADISGLVLSFGLATLIVGAAHDGLTLRAEAALLLAALPAWVVLAKLHGLYDADESHADHTTVDDVVGVFHVCTAGVWLVYLGAAATGLAVPSLPKLILFWASALVLVPAGRGIARAACRRSVAFLQNTVIVGAGEVGQLIARKMLQHPEYGLNVVGFVDPRPRERRGDLGHVSLLGTPEDLPEIVKELEVERVIIAFSNEPHDEMLDLIHALRDADLQIDLVPRLFEAVGPRVALHTIEGMPLVALPPSRLSPSSRLLKRALDVTAASFLLLLTAPFFAVIAFLVRRDSPGPALFRQKRLGQGMREFEVLKFRTMRLNADDGAHREYIQATMSSSAETGANGTYKLDRPDAVTRVGRWLRKTSLDELPQLVNVLRGDMSLVGPRPCLRYETEHFLPHHFERFHVPAGITGLWQVTARASASFGEALGMDVAYVRGWSLGLDLRLLCRTPFAVLRQRRSTS
jgi:exopolysaccharide biosynthesis polyprenyl glycosylphosphotransferase